MIPEKPNIEEYISKFHPDQKKRVRKTYNNFLEDLDQDKIEPSVRQDISLEREHVDLVRAISSGFHQRPKAPGSESGFKFSCTDPLSQVDRISTEADVLLARTREFSRVQLCVVACEIDDSQVPEWISNINNIYEVFSKQENQNIILEQISHDSKKLDKIQYVCLVKSEDFEDLAFTQIESRCDADELALWSVDMNGHSEICHEGGSLIHKDLREVLDNCFDYDITENPIEYTLGSDPIIPLENILYRLVRGKDKYEDTDYPLEFTRSEFVEYYKKGLKLSIPDGQAEEIINQNALVA